MSDPNGGGGSNRTVFRPSPLERMREEQRQAAAPPPISAPARLGAVQDDVPEPPTSFQGVNPLMTSAGPLLALLASLRAGRAQMPLPQLHHTANAAIADFQTRFNGRLSEEHLRRAVYALAATADDIALNLPGQGAEAAEWARRSLVVRYFQEAIGGDRFWRLLDQMVAQPSGHEDLLELYHACMAAGFEGRYRVAEHGRQLHRELLQRVYQALPSRGGLSRLELVPNWRGLEAPAETVGMWGPVAMAAAIAAGLLLVIYIVLRIVLAQTGAPALAALDAITPNAPLRLSREAPLAAAPAGAQAARIRTFLAPEIAQGLVVVIEDPSTVRVRTTVGQLFKSGSDQLQPERVGLFGRIAEALNTEPGPVRVEGYTDADRPRGLSFPDNLALSQARADMVAELIRRRLADPARVSAEGLAEAQPIAPNDTMEGKSRNRRVEVVVNRVS